MKLISVIFPKVILRKKAHSAAQKMQKYPKEQKPYRTNIWHNNIAMQNCKLQIEFNLP